MAITVSPMPMKKFSEQKDKDEQRFMVSDAIHAFKRLPELKREIAQMKKDKPLMKVVRVALKKEIEDSKKAVESAR